MVPKLYPYAAQLQELFLFTRTRDRLDAVDWLINEAPKLRSLSLVHSISAREIGQGKQLDFADFIIRKSRPFLENQHIKHLTLSRIALSDDFSPELLITGPTLAPRLKCLYLMGCIVSDSDLYWLCDSQEGW